MPVIFKTSLFVLFVVFFFFFFFFFFVCLFFIFFIIIFFFTKYPHGALTVYTTCVFRGIILLITV